MQITQAFEKEPVINEALPQTNVTDCGNFEQTGAAAEILDQKRTRRTMRMYSAEQRMKAVETFARFGCSAADTIAELGYPNRNTLRNWWKE